MAPEGVAKSREYIRNVGGMRGREGLQSIEKRGEARGETARQAGGVGIRAVVR